MDLPVEGETFDDGLVEIVTNRCDECGQVLQLTGTDHVEGAALFHLEHIGNIISEQLGSENTSVVTGIPFHIDFRGGVLGSVAFDSLFHPLLSILVVPLGQGWATARRLFAAEPGVGAAGAECGRSCEAAKS